MAFANDDFENARRVKYYWEIIADNLKKPVGVGVASQRLISTGEQSGSLTRIGTTESGS